MGKYYQGFYAVYRKGNEIGTLVSASTDVASLLKLRVVQLVNFYVTCKSSDIIMHGLKIIRWMRQMRKIMKTVI